MMQQRYKMRAPWVWVGGALWAWALAATPAAGRTILVLYALEADGAALRGADPAPAALLKAGERAAQRITAGIHTLYAAPMGAGPIESAITTEALLAATQADLVLSVGVAGALAADLAVGDWVEIGGVVPYQQGRLTEAGLQRRGDPPAPCGAAAGLADPLPEAWRNARRVVAASGEAFVAAPGARDQLARETGAAVVEMNLAGVAAACRNRGVPHVHFRLISDLADAAAGESFQQFVASYDGAGGHLARIFAEALGADPRDPRTYQALQKLLANPADGLAGHE